MNFWSLVAHACTRLSCSAFCAHCALPAPVPCFREGCEDGPAFCCRACRQVYDLVRELPDADLVNEEKLVAYAD